MRFASARERLLWSLAVLLLITTYSTLYWARSVSDYLRDRHLLVATLVLMAAGVLAVLVGITGRSRAGRWEWAVSVAAALAYLTFLPFMVKPEEALHLLQYGAVGGLFYAALSERWSAASPPFTAAPAVLAFLLTASAGWLDEGIQYLLPNRYYDLRDAAFNASAGILAIATLAGRRWARGLDRRKRQKRS